MLDSNLYKINEEQGPVQKSLGNRTEIPPVNPNEPFYYRNANFPQMGMIGFGYVLATGLVGDFCIPQSFIPLAGIKGGTGVYTITHNIGSVKYIPIINLRDTASKNFTVEVNANTTVIRTFTSNTAAAVDTAFMFVFYLNP